MFVRKFTAAFFLVFMVRGKLLSGERYEKPEAKYETQHFWQDLIGISAPLYPPQSSGQKENNLWWEVNMNITFYIVDQKVE